MDALTVLYRPVGLMELVLISESGFKCFPPRLDWQPIFYPVTNRKYAEQIASEWNTNDEFSGYSGFVTRFAVSTSFLRAFEQRNVGAKHHNEYWIPAERLEEFNKNIHNNIEVVQAYYGKGFKRPSDPNIISLIQQIQ